MFVGETGVAANHHFLTPKDASSFRFIAGQYRIDVFVHLVGDRKRKLLFSQTLEVTNDIAKMLEEPRTGLYFDWGPDASRYVPHVDKRAPSPDPEDFLELLRSLPSESRNDEKSETRDRIQDESQPDLFGAEAPPVYRPDLDKVRARLHKILAEARAAQKLPWEPTRVSLYRTIFPQMTNWLPEDEGA